MKVFSVNPVSPNENTIPEDSLVFLWRRKKPSAGYHRAYSGIMPDGTRIELEYNFIREIVKIEFFPVNEENHYLLVIQRGHILQQTDSFHQKDYTLPRKIAKYKHYFSYLVDEQILKSISGCCQIPEKSQHPQATSDFRILQYVLTRKNEKFPQRFLSYIRSRIRKNEERQKQLKGIQKLLYRLPADFFDMFVVFLMLHYFMLGKLYSFYFSFLSIFYGIASGFLDIYWRRRNPYFPKTLLLIFPGILVFWFQYQLYTWHIYEPVHKYLDLFQYLLREKLREVWISFVNLLPSGS